MKVVRWDREQDELRHRTGWRLTLECGHVVRRHASSVREVKVGRKTQLRPANVTCTFCSFAAFQGRRRPF